MKILILAGGRGTRLWPISRNFKPKQFQIFSNKKTLFQMTFERALKLAELKNIFVSTNEWYFDEIKREIPKLPEKNIILEPSFRERVAAFLLFFCFLKDEELKKPIVVFPSDHLIKKEKKFFKILKIAYDFVSQNPDHILLFGEKPKYPDVGLGYIQKGKLLKKIKNLSFYTVSYFKEKPNLKKAKLFLKSKNYFWNTGIFIFVPELIVELTKKFVPDNYRIYETLKGAFINRSFKKILKREYLKMDVASFDYSILENYQKNVFVPISIGWSDIGSWLALKNYFTSKEKSFIKGNFLGIDSKNILVYGTSPQLVATLGVEDLVIAVTDDVVFVCKKEKAHEIKKLINQIERRGKKEYL